MAESSMAALAGLFKGRIQDSDWQSLRLFSRDLHPADIAETMHFLDAEEKVALIRALNADQRADVVALTSDRSLESLLERLDKPELAEIIQELPADDAADLLGEMDRQEAAEVLELLGDASPEVEHLLTYDEDTAGGIMDTDFVAVQESESREQIIESLRQAREEDSDLHSVYVVNQHNKLVGTLSVLEILLAREDGDLRRVIGEEVVSVAADLDQEEVAGLFSKYDLLEMPVVGAQGELLGRITVDDVIDVIEDEASEDLAKMAGTTEQDIGSTSVFKISSSRIRWLVIGLGGGLFSAILMGLFESDLLAANPAFYFFVPVITAMGGNIGIQCSTVIVRALAMREVDAAQLGSTVARETRVAFLNASILVPILFAATFALRQDVRLSLVVCGAMLVVFIYSSTMGVVVPMLLVRRKIDPAVATGPFITTSNDIVGILIYLSLVTVALRSAS